MSSVIGLESIATEEESLDPPLEQPVSANASAADTATKPSHLRDRRRP
ncbi:hypothetical protein [Nocardia huaxiensis]